MNVVAVRAVSCAAAGLPDWQAARAVLAGQAAYRPETLGKLQPAYLPPNERRRLSAVMRLALHVGEQALEASGCARETPASVFASSSGDGDIIHAICEELAQAEPAVSPTRFHNSVHNAPAGYWAIATRSHSASTAIGACDATFAAGWVEAALLAGETTSPVLFVAYDRPLPPPLHAKRPLAGPFACAFLLDPDPDPGADGIARVAMQRGKGTTESRLDDPALEGLRRGNPAARALPLLSLIARGEKGAVALPWLPEASLSLEVAPAA